MSSINRGEGITASERKLAQLADKTFLRLWSYPNTFNDRTKSTSGGGQEFADLLVVFDKHVLLFSDKEVEWQAHKPIPLAWSRWYRKAIKESVDQLIGAERWLSKHPDRIFTDKACTQPLPLDLPPKDERIVHLIAVASGANQACRRFFGHSRGTMVLEPGLKGDQHVNSDRIGFHPFVIGDANADGSFVHVFDPVGLEFVLTELDTAADLTAYLVARERLVRSRKLGIATGEEDLLASYMMNGFIDGTPGFVPKKLRTKARRKLLSIPEGEYETYISSAVYGELSRQREASLAWDRMIEIISDDVLGGTSIGILGEIPTTNLSERALRVMAAENRFNRIRLAEALQSAIERSVAEQMSRFVRRLLIARRPPQRQTGYLFLILPYREESGSYAQYRDHRAAMLQTYCMSFFEEQPKLQTIVGLALDIYVDNGTIKTRSEDLLACDAPSFTPEFRTSLEEARITFGLKDPGELEGRAIGKRLRNPFRINRSARPFS
ncbi:hypothetical protein [Rhizorhabdus phycosphaerae]|uniref:hypothetical protein n=1 Tax=Rhizorhabdus phycosphaerae TaxID=2711156 RepID=UPI0013EB9366|nr:hypothetical protein [Rhizorhabdus phycosphaerae]